MPVGVRHLHGEPVRELPLAIAGEALVRDLPGLLVGLARDDSHPDPELPGLLLARDSRPLLVGRLRILDGGRSERPRRCKPGGGGAGDEERRHQRRRNGWARASGSGRGSSALRS